MPTAAQTRPKRAKPIRSSLTVQEIVEAAHQLRGDQLHRLRLKLEEIEEARWQRGREAAARRMAAKGITDDDIDEIVMRMRRESRR
jgi:hypothetical protein